MNVGIHEAKTHFSKLIPAALAGEEVIITNAGQAVAKLVPIKVKSGLRELGAYRGKVVIHGDPVKPLPKKYTDDFWKADL